QSVLANVAARPQTEGADFVTQFQQEITQALGHTTQTLPAEMQRMIQVISHGLNQAQEGGRGVGGILDELKVDASKFWEKLTGPIVDPIREAGTRFAGRIEEETNRYIEGITRAAAQTRQIGETRDRQVAIGGQA